VDLQLTDEQIAFRDEVRRFIRERLPAEVQAQLRRGLTPKREHTVAWQRALNERGWAAPHWPKAYGGGELGQMERLILMDEIFAAPAPLPLSFNITMLGPVLLEYGTEAQKKFFVPKILNLDLWFCQGFSEPGSGSDLASLRTSAQREGDTYVVNGQKIWTSYAHYADWIFALVRTDQSARKQDGISFLLIDLKSPGVTVRPILSIDGRHHLNEVFFDNVRVPVGNLVGTEGRGWDCAKFLLANERTGIAQVGFCRERLDFARQVAASIRQGAGTLLDDPKIKADMAVLEAEVRALEITNLRFLTSPEQAAQNPAFANVLKLKGVALQQEITALLATIAGPAGLENHAAKGFDAPWTGAVMQKYLYLRAASIYGGTSEVQKDILSRFIFG